ncbi:MFS transporter [Leucobacter triazinivorans]|uniref:MFS transporter n=1 Tax=Leucobacter triazinivorans TaxID=1784719 RepID=A0A4P6KGZ3_9MICO|nr:MFS transporter [Leucobacter triazinivorans]QBE49787.1 MFS transporter [Leucobacter triazinivorans]
MGMYRDLGRNPGVFRILFSQLTARFPFGMLSIILLLHIQLAYGDFTSAGIVLATQSIGQAISGPLSSRLMGRWGMRRVLSITSVLCSALLVTIALVHLPLPLVAAIAFLVGLSTPPVTPAVRTLYPKLVPGNQLSALFSLDASAQEIIWVLGPVVAVFVSSQFGTAAGLCVAAAFLLGGGAWFILSRAVGEVQLLRSKRGLGAVLRYPTVVISTVMGFFFVASFAAIEAGIVAAFAGSSEHGDSGGGHGSIESGIVLAIFAGGSLVGGLLIGHRAMRPWSPLLRIGVVLVGTAACLVSLNMWWLSAVLFIGGLGTAPVFAAISNIVSSTVKFSETAEAYGWIGTGQLVGVATGSALGGVAIDAGGAHGAILVSTALLVVAAAVAAGTVRWIPDLKGRTVEPPPETGTLALPLP